MAAILKISKCIPQLKVDIRYEKSVPNYIYEKKVFFYDDDVIDDVTGWPGSLHLYSCVGEVGSWNKQQGQYLVNRCEYRYRLCKLYMPKEDLNK